MIYKIYRVTHLVMSVLLLFLNISLSFCMQRRSWQRLIPYTKKISPFITRRNPFYFQSHAPFLSSFATRHYVVPKHPKATSEKGKSVVEWYFQDDTQKKLSEQSKLQELQRLASFFPTETVQAFLEAPQKNQTAFLNKIQSDQKLKTALSEAIEEQAKELNRYGDGRKLLTAVVGKEYLSSAIPEYETYAKTQSKIKSSSNFDFDREKYIREQEEKMKAQKAKDEEALKRRPETIEDFFSKLTIGAKYQNFIPSDWISHIIKKYPGDTDRIKEKIYDAFLICIQKWDISEIPPTLLKDPTFSAYILDEMVTKSNKLFQAEISTSRICSLLEALINEKTTIPIASFIANNLLPLIKNYKYELLNPIYSIESTIKKIINHTHEPTRQQVQEIISQAFTNETVIDEFLKRDSGAFYLSLIIQNINNQKNFDLSTFVLNSIIRNSELLFDTSKNKISHIYSLLKSIMNKKTAIPIASFITDNIKNFIDPDQLDSVIQEIIKNTNKSDQEQIQSIFAQALDDNTIDKILKEPSGALFITRIVGTKSLINYLTKEKNITQLALHSKLDDFIWSFRHANLSLSEKLEFYKIAIQHEKALKKIDPSGKLFNALLGGSTETKFINWLLYKFSRKENKT